MELYNSPDEYLFNLETSSSADAKRLWRKSIREKWNYRCAYCGSEQELTIDHIIPQSKGGSDSLHNVISCCKSCNQSKGHNHWEDWYSTQDFYTEERRELILDWMVIKKSDQLIKYKRKNAIP